MITFSDPAPYLTASETDVIIPEGGEMSVTVSATGLEGVITYMISKTSGTASVASDTDGDMVTITASGEGSAMVSVTASAGGMTTEAVDILFRAMPTVGSDMRLRLWFRKLLFPAVRQWSLRLVSPKVPRLRSMSR